MENPNIHNIPYVRSRDQKRWKGHSKKVVSKEETTERYVRRCFCRLSDNLSIDAWTMQDAQVACWKSREKPPERPALPSIPPCTSKVWRAWFSRKAAVCPRRNHATFGPSFTFGATKGTAAATAATWTAPEIGSGSIKLVSISASRTFLAQEQPSSKDKRSKQQCQFARPATSPSTTK